MSIEQWHMGARPKLAKAAWAFADKKEIQEQLAELDVTALRTVLAASLGTSCLYELRIVMRYQQARDPKKWPQSLMGPLEQAVESAVNSVVEGRAAVEAQREAAEARAAATFLGFVAQLHRYHKELRGGGRR